MRFMVLIKASKASEAGDMSDMALMEAIGKFNEELITAGVLLSCEGLHPSSAGMRIDFSNGKATVTDGPFAEAKELIAGFWIVEMKSKEEAIEWFSRCPGPNDGSRSQLEIRRIFEMSDFSPEILALETVKREQEWRDAQEKKGN